MDRSASPGHGNPTDLRSIHTGIRIRRGRGTTPPHTNKSHHKHQQQEPRLPRQRRTQLPGDDKHGTSEEATCMEVDQTYRAGAHPQACLSKMASRRQQPGATPQLSPHDTPAQTTTTLPSAQRTRKRTPPTTPRTSKPQPTRTPEQQTRRLPR
jgi:hypothetical protein